MKKEDIKSELSKCNSLPELIGRANALKRAGEKDTVVNKVVTELRKRMLNKSSGIKRLTRVEIPTINLEPTGTIMFAVNKLDAPEIYYGNNTILL